MPLVLLSLVLAAVLSFTYVPTGAQAWDDPSLGGGTGWTAWHQWSLVVWMVTAGASLVALVALAATTRPSRDAAIAAGAAVVSVVAAVVALTTRSLVQWDQLALWAVAVGDGLDGYRSALDDGVRFVLIDGVELSRGEYRAALTLHLLAHLVGVAAAVGTLAVLVARRGRADAAPAA